MVHVSKTALHQWVSAQDRSFDYSMASVDPKDGAESWTPPGESEFILNTDVALFVQNACFSTAWMIRDQHGHLVEARARCKFGRPAPEVAEVLGIKEALSWLNTSAFQNVEIQSDCLVAIQAIRSNTSLFSYFGRLVVEYHTLLSELKHFNVSLRFIKRSANSVAHF